MTEPDPLVQLLHDHMRVAIEDEHTIKCWCGERFEGGVAHFTHVAEIVRGHMAMEIDSD